MCLFSPHMGIHIPCLLWHILSSIPFTLATLLFSHSRPAVAFALAAPSCSLSFFRVLLKHLLSTAFPAHCI